MLELRNSIEQEAPLNFTALSMRTVLEEIRNYNPDITVEELLSGSIDFNVRSTDEILQQVYLNMNIKSRA